MMGSSGQGRGIRADLQSGRSGVGKAPWGSPGARAPLPRRAAGTVGSGGRRGFRRGSGIRRPTF